MVYALRPPFFLRLYFDFSRIESGVNSGHHTRPRIIKHKIMDYFFNTTNECSSNLKYFEQKAQTQEAIVINIFKGSIKGLTCSEVFQKYPDKRTPLTSIRRAISNLKDEKKLVKTTEKREGIYGRSEFVFTLYTGQLNLFN